MTKPKISKFLQGAFENFRAVQDRHAYVGAGDSEPDGVFQWYVKEFATKLALPPKLGADDWQLYAYSNDITKKALYDAAHDLNEALDRTITELKRGLAPNELEWVKQMCWRVNW